MSGTGMTMSSRPRKKKLIAGTEITTDLKRAPIEKFHNPRNRRCMCIDCRQRRGSPLDWAINHFELWWSGICTNYETTVKIVRRELPLTDGCVEGIWLGDSLILRYAKKPKCPIWGCREHYRVKHLRRRVE